MPEHGAERQHVFKAPFLPSLDWNGVNAGIQSVRGPSIIPPVDLEMEEPGSGIVKILFRPEEVYLLRGFMEAHAGLVAKRLAGPRPYIDEVDRARAFVAATVVWFDYATHDQSFVTVAPLREGEGFIRR